MATAVQKDQPLPNEYWAVMCTIKQEPQYKFVREESRLAKKMEDAGLLAPWGDKHYSITELGQKCYSAEQLFPLAN